MLHITRFTPEGALTGAEKALVADDGFASVEATAQRFRVIPLSGTPLFEELSLNVAEAPPLRPKPLTQDQLLGLFSGDAVGRDVVLEPATAEDMHRRELVSMLAEPMKPFMSLLAT